MRSVLFISSAFFLSSCASLSTPKEGLSRTQISSVIESNRSQLVRCYEDRIAAKPKLSGQVVVAFLVSPNGRVSDSRIKESTLGDSVAENCIVSVLKSSQFPEPGGKASVKVVYPFKFTRVKLVTRN